MGGYFSAVAVEAMSEAPWPKLSASSRLATARLILIRHPQTEANAAHLLQGSTDSSLTSIGQRQLESLCQLVALWPYEDLPRTVVHSPLGRCEKVARAVANVVQSRLDERRGDTGIPATSDSSINGTDISLESDQPQTGVDAEAGPSRPVPRVVRLPSIDLQERDFGPAECTRRGVHAGSKFPRARSRSKRESEEAFRSRVRRSGMLWMRKACDMGSEAARERLRVTPRAEHSGPPSEVKNGGQDDGPDPNSSSKAAGSAAIEPESRSPLCSTTASSGTPVVLLVTHGLWISTFFKIFPPSNVGGVGFAQNTGMFLVDLLLPACPLVDDNRASPGRVGNQNIIVRVVRANWTPHLTGALAGIDNTSKAYPIDAKQRRLDTFFTQPATAAPSLRLGKRKDQTDVEETSSS